MRFFFYGTLTHEHANAVTAAVQDRLIQPRRARVRGTLYAVETSQGWYPALDPRGPGQVHGYSYVAGPGFSRETLALLDRYEDYLPHHPRGSDYLRRRVPVRLARGGLLIAHAYLWNRRIDAKMRAVPHGDFARFLMEQRFPAYCSGPEA